MRTTARTLLMVLMNGVQAAGGGPSGSGGGGGGRRGRNGMTMAAGRASSASGFGAVVFGSWLVMGFLSPARGQTSAVKSVKAIAATMTDSDTAVGQAALG